MRLLLLADEALMKVSHSLLTNVLVCKAEQVEIIFLMCR
jgi:hypothetical protein